MLFGAWWDHLLGLGCVGVAHLLDQSTQAPRWQLVLIVAAVAVASCSLCQVWPERFADLFSHRTRTLAEPCPNGVVAPFGQAYRWVRENAPAGSVVYVFRGAHSQFLYCLWNRDFSNRVEIAEPASEPAFRDLLSAPAPVILFLPHDTRAYRVYQRRSARFTEGFVDVNVSVVIAR